MAVTLLTANERLTVVRAPRWLHPVIAEGADGAPADHVPAADPSEARQAPPTGPGGDGAATGVAGSGLVGDGAAADVAGSGAAGPGSGAAGAGGGAGTLTVAVEDGREAFGTRGWAVLTRGAFARDGELLATDICGSGFDLHLRASPEEAAFTLRWRPSPRALLLHQALRSRFHLLARAVLLQYPALWWAGVHGRAPLHAPACTAGPATPLLAGPGGVGKTTLLGRELAAGGTATSDNLSVSDGTTVWGLVEPMRADGLGGRRMPHGRGEARMPNRVPELQPDRVVVLRRGQGDAPTVRHCTPDTATRALVAGTYIAGELRRYWSYAALLAAATGLGPAHPPVEQVAAELAGRLPCVEVVLARTQGASLAELLSTAPARV